MFSYEEKEQLIKKVIIELKSNYNYCCVAASGKFLKRDHCTGKQQIHPLIICSIQELTDEKI